MRGGTIILADEVEEFPGQSNPINRIIKKGGFSYVDTNPALDRKSMRERERIAARRRRSRSAMRKDKSALCCSSDEEND